MEKKPTCLIVDDEKALLQMLSQSLASYGYNCETFANGEEVLARIRTSPADVLITDIVMRGLRGFELTKEVKRIRPDIMVIAMTGYIDHFSYEQAIEAGAADFIKKPFTVQELLMRIKHVKMQERLRNLSMTDELTGLLNRRGFFALAEQQMKIFNRLKGAMILLFADIDSFKTINDTWGHQEGDEALSALAKIFRETFRESDIIARMSGDEFAVLLIDTPEKNISLVNGRLQQNIDIFNKSHRARYTLAISTGLVVYDPEQPRSIDDLLKEADAIMYTEKQRKKAGGRE